MSLSLSAPSRYLIVHGEEGYGQAGGVAVGSLPLQEPQ